MFWVIGCGLEVELSAWAFTASSSTPVLTAASGVFAAVAALACGLFTLLAGASLASAFVFLLSFWFLPVCFLLFPAVSRSIWPTMCGPFTSGTAISTTLSSAFLALLAERFFSWRSCMRSSALSRRFLSALKAFLSNSYCLSSSFWLGSLLATGAPFSFKRSVIDCSPTPNSLIALFNLILMQ